jgi:hypothetical protein
VLASLVVAWISAHLYGVILFAFICSSGLHGAGFVFGGGSGIHVLLLVVGQLLAIMAWNAFSGHYAPVPFSP